jgi:hypothetical protein
MARAYSKRWTVERELKKQQQQAEPAAEHASKIQPSPVDWPSRSRSRWQQLARAVKRAPPGRRRRRHRQDEAPLSKLRLVHAPTGVFAPAVKRVSVPGWRIYEDLPGWPTLPLSQSPSRTPTALRCSSPWYLPSTTLARTPARGTAASGDYEDLMEARWKGAVCCLPARRAAVQTFWPKSAILRLICTSAGR